MEFPPRRFSRAPVDGCCPFQRREIVSTVNGRHNYALLARSHQLGVHYDPGGPVVAIGEGVDLGKQKHHEDCALEPSPQASVEIEALHQRAGDKIRCHEDRGPRAIFHLLEDPGPLVGTAFHDRRLASNEQRFKCGGIR